MYKLNNNSLSILTFLKRNLRYSFLNIFNITEEDLVKKEITIFDLLDSKIYFSDDSYFYKISDLINDIKFSKNKNVLIYGIKLPLFDNIYVTVFILGREPDNAIKYNKDYIEVHLFSKKITIEENGEIKKFFSEEWMTL